MTIYGWDASDFDWDRGPMDLAAARKDGISFFTHKATESNNTQHVHYGEAMNRARAAGIPFLGPYHVVRTLDVNTQVDYHLAYVNAQTPWWKTFPGWFFQADLEKWRYDAVAPNLGVAFAAEVERRTGRRCILYGPQWAYGNSIGGSAPLWASAYGSNPAGPWRNAYPGDNSPAWGGYSGRTPVILQFGSQATIGRQPICDINAFRGSVADFAALINGEAGLGGGVPITPEVFMSLTDVQQQQMYDRVMGLPVNSIINTEKAVGHARAAIGAVQSTVSPIGTLLSDPARGVVAQLAQARAQIAALTAEIAALKIDAAITPEQLAVISQAAKDGAAIVGHNITLNGSIA